MKKYNFNIIKWNLDYLKLISNKIKMPKIL